MATYELRPDLTAGNVAIVFIDSQRTLDLARQFTESSQMRVLDTDYLALETLDRNPALVRVTDNPSANVARYLQPVVALVPGAVTPGTALSRRTDGVYEDAETTASTRWLAPVATKADLPAGGTVGDARLVLADESNGGVLAIYGWDGTAWQLAAGGGGGGSSMSILTGTTAPSGSTGGDGDYYLRFTGSELLIYGPKAAGAWPSGTSLIKRPTVADEGTPLALEDTINFTGAGVTASDNSGSGRTDVTIPGLGVADEGSVLTRRTTLNFVGSGVSAADNSGTSATDVTITGTPRSFVSDTPEAHGAKRDGRVVTGLAITSGAAILTSATAMFASTDAGKSITVRSAGAASNIALSTTILSYQSSTQVTLSANAGATVASAGTATIGTDDTAAITAAVQAAYDACVADGSNYCEIQFSSGTYLCSAATTKGGATKGNAQIPLPVNAPGASQKVTIVFRGMEDGASIPHWDQTLAQHSGTVIQSTLIGQTPDGTWGSPSVIGGPTVDVAAGPTEKFSNVRVINQAVTVIAPYNPSVIAWDMRRAAQFDVPNGFVTADASPTILNTKPTNSNGIGLYFPQQNNNDSSNVGVLSIEGFYYGIGHSDHLVIERAAIIYCNTALFWNTGGLTSLAHGCSILYLSIEACLTAWEISTGISSRMPVFVGLMDLEIVTGTYDINDVRNALHGEIHIAVTDAYREPRVNGCKNVKITNTLTDRGAMGTGGTMLATPTLPASTTATTPLYRDAMVCVSGGTVTAITVDGQATGLTSGMVIVPAGKTIAVTYSSAPTWTWTLL
jgi:hypothetical protein